MKFHEKPAHYIKHITLHVKDLHAMTIFYEKTLGFKAILRNDYEVELSADGIHPLVTLQQLTTATEREQRTAGLYHIAFLLPHRSDLAHILQHFDRIGMRLGASDHDVSEALYLNDIEGNGIEIYTDRDPKTWEWLDDGMVKMSTYRLNVDDVLTEATDGWQGMPEGTILGHIHLSVTSLPAMRDFYTKGLGYNITTAYGDQALFLSTDDYHHHIGMNIWESLGAPAKKSSETGLAHFTIDVANKAAADKIMHDLRPFNAEITPLTNGFSTIDPSGNEVRILY
ncbi:MAG TPA: VOC family protein [Metalysinibacillus sp.]